MNELEQNHFILLFLERQRESNELPTHEMSIEFLYPLMLINRILHKNATKIMLETFTRNRGKDEKKRENLLNFFPSVAPVRFHWTKYCVILVDLERAIVPFLIEADALSIEMNSIFITFASLNINKNLWVELMTNDWCKRFFFLVGLHWKQFITWNIFVFSFDLSSFVLILIVFKLADWPQVENMQSHMKQNDDECDHNDCCWWANSYIELFQSSFLLICGYCSGSFIHLKQYYFVSVLFLFVFDCFLWLIIILKEWKYGAEWYQAAKLRVNWDVEQMKWLTNKKRNTKNASNHEKNCLHTFGRKIEKKNNSKPLRVSSLIFICLILTEAASWQVIWRSTTCTAPDAKKASSPTKRSSIQMVNCGTLSVSCKCFLYSMNRGIFLLFFNLVTAAHSASAPSKMEFSTNSKEENIANEIFMFCSLRVAINAVNLLLGG